MVLDKIASINENITKTLTTPNSVICNSSIEKKHGKLDNN